MLARPLRNSGRILDALKILEPFSEYALARSDTFIGITGDFRASEKNLFASENVYTLLLTGNWNAVYDYSSQWIDAEKVYAKDIHSIYADALVYNITST